ncbi:MULTISPECIES: non-canonical purine NTP diphosphatase [unclassified Aureispira]|uniref:non-canonical purine NTP diphosphatase n=1 Tax=unclassified Aureispira TaxID=2649989 RepID=UPI0006974A1F|nr:MULTISPECIES: non-canonical purine NTP diphosphatase [unclassified Aureispira]WMX12181.1 non-canonical purine NTP diphosphatase [Aureispira sp. CCB-E]
MSKLVFATANQNKVNEIQKIMGAQYDFLSLEDIGCTEDIPETQPTIVGNALQKARYVYEKYGMNCFAEDTGLQIHALDGAPGVYSARYAGPARDANNNMDKVLTELGDTDNRAAQFKTVIALILDGKEYTFEGIVEGYILKERQGTGGFGYDPIFRPRESDRTFAEMSSDEKGKISHRGRATEKLRKFLLSL